MRDAENFSLIYLVHVENTCLFTFGLEAYTQL